MVELVAVALVDRVVVFSASFATFFGILYVKVVLIEPYVWLKITFQIFSTLALLGFFFLYLLQRARLFSLRIYRLFVFSGRILDLARRLGVIQACQARVVMCPRHLAMMPSLLRPWRPAMSLFSWREKRLRLQVEIEVQDRLKVDFTDHFGIPLMPRPMLFMVVVRIMGLLFLHVLQELQVLVLESLFPIQTEEFLFVNAWVPRFVQIVISSR